MGNDWATIGKVTISAVPALLILFGFILLAGMMCETYVPMIVNFGVFMITGGVVLFIFEIVVIYHSR